MIIVEKKSYEKDYFLFNYFFVEFESLGLVGFLVYIVF